MRGQHVTGHRIQPMIPLHHSLTREDVRWLRQHAELADVRTVQLDARGCPTLHWEERPKPWQQVEL